MSIFVRPAARAFASNDEVMELVKLDAESRGVHFYCVAGNNAADAYNEVRKAAVSGGTITIERIARGLYVEPDTKRAAVLRYLRRLERCGLVEFEGVS